MQRYRSRRSIKRLGRKSKRNFIITLTIIGVLVYATINWVLPNFIGGISYVSDIIKPPQQKSVQTTQSETLAPPVLNIPYEATNTAQINIAGYGTPDSQVRIYLDDEAKDTQDVSSDGSFLFTDISLNLGTNNIYGKTVDNGSESLPSKTIRLVYIQDKPQLTVNEPEDGKKIQGGDKKVKVSGKTDPGMKVYVNDSQVILGNDGNFATDISLNDGDNMISIKAQDDAQNTTEIQRTVNFTP